MLRRKHLSALSLASLPYQEIFVQGEASTFIVVDNNNIVDVIEFLHDNFPEDKPIIPLKMEKDVYWLYINANEK